MSPTSSFAATIAVLAYVFVGIAGAKECSPAPASCALLPAASSAFCSSYFSSNKIKTTSCTSTATAAQSVSTKVVSAKATTTTTVFSVSTRTIQQTMHRSQTSTTKTTPTTTTTTTTGTDTSTVSITDYFTSTVETDTSTVTTTTTTTSQLPIKMKRAGTTDCACFKTSTIVITVTPQTVSTTTIYTSTSTKTVTDKSVTTTTISNVQTTATFTATSTSTSRSSTTTTIPVTQETSTTIPTTFSTTATTTSTSTIVVPANAPLGTSGYLEVRPVINYVNGVPAKYCRSDAAHHLTDNTYTIGTREFFIVTPDHKLYSVTNDAYYHVYSGTYQNIYWGQGAAYGTSNFFIDQTSGQPDGSVRLQVGNVDTPGQFYQTCLTVASGGDGGTTGLHIYTNPDGTYDDCKLIELYLSP